MDDFTFEWDNILQYFERSVRFTPPNTAVRFPNATTTYNAEVFNDDKNKSAIDVSYLNSVSPFSTWFIKAMKAAGLPEIKDFNSGELLGTQYSSSTVSPDTEQRSSADLIIAAAKSKSLQVCAHAMAQRILFDDSNNAIGVQAENKEDTFTAFAKKEVIVSAGAFQSPQLLMVSGIGPKDVLDSMNIAVIKDLPGVGQNMWDHIFFGVSFPILLDTATRYFNDPDYQTQQTLQYLAKKSGAPAGGLDLIGWEKVPQKYRANFSKQTEKQLAGFPADWPEVEVVSPSVFFGII